MYLIVYNTDTVIEVETPTKGEWELAQNGEISIIRFIDGHFEIYISEGVWDKLSPVEVRA